MADLRKERSEIKYEKYIDKTTGEEKLATKIMANGIDIIKGKDREGEASKHVQDKGNAYIPDDNGEKLMKTHVITRDQLDSDNNYVGAIDLTNFDGSLEADKDFGNIKFKSLSIAGYIWFKAGSGIEADEGIKAGWGIKAGFGIEAGGWIEVGGAIKAGWGIEAEGGIEAGLGIQAGRGIEAGWGIKANEGIEADRGIEAVGGIAAGGVIKAGWGIKAGGIIKAVGGIAAGGVIEANEGIEAGRGI